MSCREGRADPEIRSAKRTTLCKALQSWLELFHTTLRCTETKHFLWSLHRSFQDCWWDPEFSQLSQMVQSLPGFLDLCLDVCSPSQVLGDVYAEVLEAAYSLHRGPTDHKRSVGQQVSSFWSPQSALWFCSRSERDSCPGTMMLVSPPHPSMRSHHCWKWGPEPQYHQQIW